MTSPSVPMGANKNKQLSIDVDGVSYNRIPIKTHLITVDDDLLKLVEKYVVPHLISGDCLFISEKIVAITQGRIILIRDVKPSRFAKFLAKRIGVNFGTKKFRGFGLGTPPAMQLAIQEAGIPRILLGAILAAITKPFGIKGMFYRIIGPEAKSIDCPASYILWPYHQYAKLAPLNPENVAKSVTKETKHETVIIDANYIGVSVLGKSSSNLSDHFAEKVFRDNPLGQGDEQTPLCIVRKLS